MRYLSLFLLLSAGFWACQPDEACISSATSQVVLDFFVDTVHIDTINEATLVRRDSLFRDSVDLLSVTSATSQSIFWEVDPENPKGTPRVVLALDPNQDETAFFFQYRPDTEKPTDTLVLRYQRRYRLISTDCPLEVSFNELQVVRSTFDTVGVINTELVEPNNETDIQIIRPREQ